MNDRQIVADCRLGELFQISMTFISTSGEPSVNRIDLLALTLVGPTQHKSVLDPLAVQHLENQYPSTKIPKSKKAILHSRLG